MGLFGFLFEVPYSMLFIFFVNILIVFAGSLIFRLMVNIDRLEAQESEVHSYDRSLSEAKRKNDKAILRRLKREEIRMKRISASASKQRMKASMVTILPFAAASIILSIVFVPRITNEARDIVSFPFEFVLFNKSYSFSVWYFLTYLTAYLPLSRIFRTSPSFWGQSSGVKSG